MITTPDMRIPIFISRHAEAAALLIEGEAPVPASTYAMRFDLSTGWHFVGCSCCVAHGPVAVALAAMFRARATGTAPYFKCVILHASPAGLAEVSNALAEDAVTTARYYLTSNELR